MPYPTWYSAYSPGAAPTPPTEPKLADSRVWMNPGRRPLRTADHQSRDSQRKFPARGCGPIGEDRDRSAPGYVTKDPVQSVASGDHGGMEARDGRTVHVSRSSSTRSSRSADTGLFRAWTASVTVGEFVGFCVPALVGGFVIGTSTPVAVALMVAAGSVEGAVLGWSQARVLGRVLPELSARRWVVGTAIAAAFAWLIGLLPSTFGSALSTWPVGVLVVVGVILGTLLLCSIGTAQWVELRRHVPQAGWWVLVTAAAWCVGLLAFFPVTSLLWQPGQPVLLVAAIGVMGGLIMAVTMAATSGWALVRLFGSAWSWGRARASV
jgi:hypothetical protein